MNKWMLFLPAFALSLAAGASPARADRSCNPCPYSCETLGISGKHCSYRESDRPGFCCVDLDDKGKSQALVGQAAANTYGQGYGGVVANDRCPPGFSPSEQKCSANERRRGCRDIRLPSGLGCVSRR